MANNKSIVLATGGFDPIHGGHINYLKAAAKIGDKLIVGLNSDEWLTRKKGYYFMNFNDCKSIVKNLTMVDDVIDFDDSDGTAIQAIKKIKFLYPNNKIIFANGGDRTIKNIPEYMPFKDDSKVDFVFEVGGLKTNSSSDIVQKWIEKLQELTIRNWGKYRVLYNFKNVKVKELEVKPGKSISMQRHRMRKEFWFVVEGQARIILDNISILLNEHQWLEIPEMGWHKLYNDTDSVLKIVEIQTGGQCVEKDIERV